MGEPNRLPKFLCSPFNLAVFRTISTSCVNVGENMRSTIPSMFACPSISRVILYVKDIPKVATFYETFFGMRRIATEEPGWLELEGPGRWLSYCASSGQ